MKLISRLTCLFISTFFLYLQGTTDSSIRYANAVYEGDVRSIVFENKSSGFNLPLIALGGKESALKLSFDQLTEERDYYQVTLIHCDALWKPTAISKTQYLNGMGFQEIDNVQFSSGTLTNFVHYEVELPSQDMKPKLSGNYLLLVYRNYDTEDIILSRRMMVLESKGNVQVQVNRSSQVEFRDKQQQVNFIFNKTASTYFMPNPHHDLTAVVMQNNDWMSSITNLKPQFIKGNSFQYQQMIGTQFWGNNEFRFFDIRSLQSAAAGVKKRENIGGQKHIWLITNRSRLNDAYANWKDYNGRVYYDNRDMPSGLPRGSDYCFVHFSLIADEREEPVYVYGQLSDWKVDENFKMYYNEDRGQYEAIILLKQGFYNYMYGVKTEQGLMFEPFEASHAVAENNYAVLIYHRNQMLPYDQLIGYGLSNSQPNR